MTSVAVVKMKFIFGMCDCTVDSDFVGTGDSLLVLRTVMCVGTHMCNNTCLQAWALYYTFQIRIWLLFTLRTNGHKKAA